MMNYEAYKEEIIKMLLDEGTASFGVFKGKIKTCYRAKCSECNFDGVPSCRDARKDWLRAEYIKKPKLTQREWHLCKALETGWIARDESGAVFHYNSKPEKVDSIWDLTDKGILTKINEPIFKVEFKFIKWEDEEPWSVEDLLKLEVTE